MNEQRLLEVGFHVSADKQDNGYASEAATSCTAFAATTLNASHVAAIINSANIPSRRVAEKLGMTVEQRVDLDGTDFVVYGRVLH